MSEELSKSYKVLARKYRPEAFNDLVGQDIMVQTLRNAFRTDRIAQAFILTGIRGTGKTTTARIIAKGINCIGLNGQGGPTTEPCDKCQHCKAVREGQHVDVLEMDAASRTGVDDIREIIESVHYRAASARYKVYIIDEVHMLSTNAFNALLKTLEEPPEHVKFIFATTEIRKVPVTVLSRCQRFDLRRLKTEDMANLLKKISNAENLKISDEALNLVIRASEGSARDAVSILDQVTNHSNHETKADQVRDMLGLTDRGRTLDLFDLIMKGDAQGALDELDQQYSDGADPLAILRDLTEITHWVAIMKITPDAVKDPSVSEDNRSRGKIFSDQLEMRVLTRMWQMLLKALEEVANAPNAMMAAEMVIIRLTYVADLPTPDELIKTLKDQTLHKKKSSEKTLSPSKPANVSIENSQTSTKSFNPGTSGKVMENVENKGPLLPQQTKIDIQEDLALSMQDNPVLAQFPTFEKIVELIRYMRDIELTLDVESSVKLVSYQPGRIEFEPTQCAPTDLSSRLAQKLQLWTGIRWTIILVNKGGGPTIEDVRNTKHLELIEKARSLPLVKEVFNIFPKAQIEKVEEPKLTGDEFYDNSLTSIDTNWDPYGDKLN